MLLVMLLPPRLRWLLLLLDRLSLPRSYPCSSWLGWPCGSCRTQLLLLHCGIEAWVLACQLEPDGVCWAVTQANNG